MKRFSVRDCGPAKDSGAAKDKGGNVCRPPASFFSPPEPLASPARDFASSGRRRRPRHRPEGAAPLAAPRASLRGFAGRIAGTVDARADRLTACLSPAGARAAPPCPVCARDPVLPRRLHVRITVWRWECEARRSRRLRNISRNIHYPRFERRLCNDFNDDFLPYPRFVAVMPIVPPGGTRAQRAHDTLALE